MTPQRRLDILVAAAVSATVVAFATTFALAPGKAFDRISHGHVTIEKMPGCSLP